MRFVLVATVVLTGLPLFGQDLRVVTEIRNLKAPGNTSVSLTLFHHDRVYDYTDSVVIILEPRENRFTILNLKRSLSTTVNFDEVKRLLKVRKPEIDSYLANLRKNGDPEASRAEQAFAFQLEPKFVESFDASKKQLTLTSPKLTYRVKTDGSTAPQQIKQYLDYTTWMARLNCVLHPRAMFPEPREALNASLVRNQQMPVQVELISSLDGDLHLAAEHRISTTLASHDRARITSWDNALKSPVTRQTNFRLYQEAVLIAKSR